MAETEQPKENMPVAENTETPANAAVETPVDIEKDGSEHEATVLAAPTEMSDTLKKAGGVSTNGTIKKSRELIKGNEKSNLSQTINNLVVPILAFIVFILIVIFVYLPFGREIKTTMDETKGIKDQIAIDEQKVATLRGIDIETLDNNLRQVSKVVRSEMNVSDLASQVESLALRHALKQTEVNLSNGLNLAEATADTPGATSWIPSYSSTISGPFSFTGKFTDITAFLADLRTESPTILSLTNIEVSKSISAEGENSEDKWNVDLYITGFISTSVSSVGINDPVNTFIDEELLNDLLARAEDEQTTQQSSQQSSDTSD